MLDTEMNTHNIYDYPKSMMPSTSIREPTIININVDSGAHRDITNKSTSAPKEVASQEVVSPKGQFGGDGSEVVSNKEDRTIAPSPGILFTAKDSDTEVKDAEKSEKKTVKITGSIS